jgi:hypothetical protein
MKIIAYNEQSSELKQLMNRLANNGFELLGATDKVDHLLNKAREMDGSIAFLNNEILGFMRAKEEIENNWKASDPIKTPKSSLKVFLEKGRIPILSQELWRSAMQLANERYEAGLASVHAGIYMQEHCFQLPAGYESLPAVWHVPLPGLIKYLLTSVWHGKEFMFIEKLKEHAGVLDILFFCENVIDDPCINQLRDDTRVFLNLQLYPNRWSPLLSQHQVELHNERMDLRNEIERVHERNE